MESSTARGNWSGRVGFVLAAAGSAIGLGNIWMFPYRAGQYGGAAFVLVYLGAVVLVGLPLLNSEILLGRATRRNPVGALRLLSPGTGWPVVGWLGVIAGFVILSYYGVVAGWALDYTWMAVSGQLFSSTSGSMSGAFEKLVANGPRQVLWQGLFMLATIFIVSRGVEQGIERTGKILMPLLFGIVLVLLGYSLTSEGVERGLDFFMRPRFSELGWQGALAALGQAFFSLSLGMGAMITYGSYLGEDESLPGSVAMIAVADTALAILAGLVIFPLVFTFNLEPSAGPGLVFITLPQAFAMMPAPAFLASLFFLLLIFAALTSAVSLLEVAVAFLVDEFKLPRVTASVGAGAIIFCLGLPSALSEGFLDHVDALASNWLLPVGGLCTALFVGWSLDRAAARKFYAAGGSGRGFELFHFCIKYLAPVAVGVILLQNTWPAISGLFAG
ncbi:MAG: sodium-dependent transporter [Deltaproteobacteria bacterium]|nr:sodium-dependent transporter [Deltaproteobacteria bacterium]